MTEYVSEKVISEKSLSNFPNINIHVEDRVPRLPLKLEQKQGVVEKREIKSFTLPSLREYALRMTDDKEIQGNIAVVVKTPNLIQIEDAICSLG